MNYTCNACGKSFDSVEQVCFCPFCGHRFDTKAATPAKFENITRVVIGSDSERTVQEKYWQRTHALLRSILGRLSLRIEDMNNDDYYSAVEGALLGIPKSVHDLYAGHSFAGFKKRLNEYIENLMQALEKGEIDLEQSLERKDLSFHSIEIDLEEENINSVCETVAEVLGCMQIHKLIPELIYDFEDEPRDNDQCWLYDSIVPEITLEQKELLNTLLQEKEKIFGIIEDNSIFIVSEIESVSKKKAEKLNAERISDELKRLGQLDYDYILGEKPEAYLQTFWDALIYLSYVANRIQTSGEIGYRFNTREKLEAAEEKKKAALNLLISDWRNVLSQQLDRAYQSQSEDMVNMYNELLQYAATLNDQE